MKIMDSLVAYRAARPAALAALLLGAVLLTAAAGVPLLAGAGRTPLLQSYLLAYVFWLNLALGCLGLLLLHPVVGGRWGVPIRRFLEAGVGTLPLLLLLALPLLLGLRELYPWAAPGAEASAALRPKRLYLNVPFFVVRLLVCFAIWMALGALLRRASLAQDAAPGPRSAARLVRLGAPGLVLYVLTVSFALWDLTATLDPRWYSTVYGLILIDVQGLTALSFGVIVLVLFAGRPPLRSQASRERLHDLGNLLLMLLLMWAYLSFMQLLISWSGNLPDEVRFYVPRLHGPFARIGIGLLVFHFAVPFLGLLSRPLKRSRGSLFALALLLFLGAWLDLFWLVAPGFQRTGATFCLLDFAFTLGLGGLFVGLYLIRLGGRPLLSVGAVDGSSQ
ncbi:MAG: hypothetical protein U1A78_36805 [Polyangia bacterium]